LAKLYVKLLGDSQLFGSISNYRATFTATFSICHDLSHVNRRGCTVPCAVHIDPGLDIRPTAARAWDPGLLAEPGAGPGARTQGA